MFVRKEVENCREILIEVDCEEEGLYCFGEVIFVNKMYIEKLNRWWDN